VRYGSAEAESKVMAAADAWLAAHGSDRADAANPRDTVAFEAHDDTVEVADAGHVNEIDLAAPEPPAPSFLQSLFALLGGAAAAAVATVRFLFV
jgi:hypothetical protein